MVLWLMVKEFQFCFQFPAPWHTIVIRICYIWAKFEVADVIFIQLFVNSQGKVFKRTYCYYKEDISTLQLTVQVYKHTLLFPKFIQEILKIIVDFSFSK